MFNSVFGICRTLLPDWWVKKKNSLLYLTDDFILHTGSRVNNLYQ